MDLIFLRIYPSSTPFTFSGYVYHQPYQPRLATARLPFSKGQNEHQKKSYLKVAGHLSSLLYNCQSFPSIVLPLHWHTYLAKHILMFSDFDVTQDDVSLSKYEHNKPDLYPTAVPLHILFLSSVQTSSFDDFKLTVLSFVSPSSKCQPTATPKQYPIKENFAPESLPLSPSPLKA
jgi:hypothetical protein